MTETTFFLTNDRPSGTFGSGPSEVLRTVEADRGAFGGHKRARWIVEHSAALCLLGEVGETRDTWHRLLLLEPPSMARLELLHAVFRVVIAPGGAIQMLPRDELTAVLADESPGDYFIGGVTDKDDRALVLYTGNLERLLVPFSWFKQRGHGPSPDFDDFEIIDGGQTIRLGSYEAATDAVLYELDGEARRRMRAREVERDDSLGGSVRRLRLQKGLSRNAFPGISEKTIARIERGEVLAPQDETIKAIAERLSVAVDELGTF